VKLHFGGFSANFGNIFVEFVQDGVVHP